MEHKFCCSKKLFQQALLFTEVRSSYGSYSTLLLVLWRLANFALNRSQSDIGNWGINFDKIQGFNVD